MRLTRKKYGGSYWHDDIEVDIENETYIKREVVTPVGTKLGPLEDIEDELGIDLIIFIKIIKKFSSTKENDGDIYVKYFDGSIEKVNVVYPRMDLENKRIIDEYDAINNEPYYYYFSEYGKSWALTKKELL